VNGAKMENDVNIRNEEILLIELCRLYFSDKQVEKIRRLVSVPNDWNYFADLANIHGVAALVWRNIERLGINENIPEQTKMFLRGAFLKSLSRNVFLAETAGNVLKWLNQESIRTVLLKGIALEATVYGNTGLRQMTDIDILTTPADCLKAREAMIRNGYTSLTVKSLLHENLNEYIDKHLPSLIKNDTAVEIHHELFGNRKNQLTKMLYDTSIEIKLQGEKAFIPQPQIFFLYLVRHLRMHEITGESQLRMYADLAVMITKYADKIVNHDLTELASLAGLSEALAGYLGILKKFWGVAFPGWMNEFIIKYFAQDKVERFLLFLKNSKENLPVDNRELYRQILNEIPGSGNKLLYLMGDLFPGLSFMKRRYNCSSSWKAVLYYPHRLGKLFWLIGK
jgi:hypothetical protein